jgi:hypothetical protein
MDSAIEPVRELPSEEFNRATDTREMLARAARQREAYNLDDYRIIDIGLADPSECWRAYRA